MNEKINEVKDRALNAADDLYNKLPLDKINEKLGGKVDVKTKKFKIIAAGVLAVLIVVVLCLIFGGGGAPSSSEISTCKTRLTAFEKQHGNGRKCIKISNFEKMDSAMPTPVGVELLGLQPGKECKLYRCTITWNDKTTSRGVFIRQGEKFGVLPEDI